MIRPTILWALSLAMLGGALFGLAFSLRPPAGRAYPGAFRRLPAMRGGSGFLSVTGPFRTVWGGAARIRTRGDRMPRPLPVCAVPLTSGEGAVSQGLTHRAPSPVSYALGLRALERVTDRVSQSMTGVSHQQPVASRPHAAGLRPHP